VRLLWRVFLTNAVVLTGATAALALSPATVSFPLAIAEAVVLVVGLAAMLAVDLALLRPAFTPLSRLTDFMRTVDPLSPGGRAKVARPDPEVAALTNAFNEMIERLETERRESARRALTAQEEERRRIARELHDEVGQALTATVLRLEQAGRADVKAIRGELVAAREEVRATLQDVRGIAKGLRPEALDDLGLPAALAALTNALQRGSGLQIMRSIDPQLPALAPDEQLVVYRVAQEALTNVARHADVDRASLRLRADGQRVELVVTDRGRGFSVRETAAGSGLRGIRERAVLIGAELELESAPHAGTTLRLRITPSGVLA